ncbi:MAG: alpha/beta fold hydrolase, partial [Myxococcota bacterium]
MLNHSERGDGERPTVLLHGFLGSGRNLGGLARVWGTSAPDRRFLLVDLLGHGRSPDLPADAGLDSMAAALLGWMTAAKLPPRTDVVGHSLGGRVALQARLQDTNGQVGRIGLLDIRPGPIVGSQTEDVIAALVRAPDRADSRDEMRAWLEDAGLARGLADWLLMSGENRDGGFEWRIDRAELARFHRDNRAVDPARSCPRPEPGPPGFAPSLGIRGGGRWDAHRRPA